MQATIILRYRDAREARAVTKAISPENSLAPADMRIHTKRRLNTFVTRIEYGGGLSTLNATIDDLLEAASTAERTIEVLKGLSPSTCNDNRCSRR